VYFTPDRRLQTPDQIENLAAWLFMLWVFFFNLFALWFKVSEVFGQGATGDGEKGSHKSV